MSTLRARLEGIYVILDSAAMPDILAVAKAALAAGVRLFQYREKATVQSLMIAQLLSLTRPANALLIINDDIEMACMADGIHLGQEDLKGRSIAEVRRLLPAGHICGISAHSEDLVKAAQAADYLGVGPFAPTTTKFVNRPPLQLTGITALTNVSSIPICAIGGIELDDIPKLRHAGAKMVALIGLVARAADYEQVCHEALTHWRKADPSS